MLKGDVSVTPLADVLTDLAGQAATGCLHLDDDAGDEALVYVKNGLVYAAYVPGRRPQLGARLISSGALAPEALAEALDAQETELQGWRLGELLVHLGYVDRGVVEAFVLEQLREATFDLSRWPSGRFRFRKNEKTREDVGTHATVEDLLAEVARRREEWEVIAGVVHGPGAVPVLSAGGVASAEMTLDQDQWALLCKVDGERTIAQLARDCGFTTFEAGQIVFSLVGAGLLDVEETFEDTYDPPPVVDEDLAPLGAALASAFASFAEPEVVEVVVPPQAESYEDESEVSRLLGTVMPEPEPSLDTLSAAFADLPSLSLPTSLEPEYPVVPDPVAPPAPVAADPFGDSLARVSEALSALMGDALPAVSLPATPLPPVPTAEEIEADRLETERQERSRAAAAAELAEAHALAEAARQGRAPQPRIGRRARAEDAARREAEEAARVEAEQAARVEAERVAAEHAARAEAARIADEQAAAEEAERVEAERIEAERIEAERVDAERIEAERVEAERVEAERIEAERIDAERIDAERIEAERVDAERAAAAQAAAEEAARVEAAEAARVIAELAAEQAAAEQAAADEAARAEAEQAERAEAERREADRLAAEAAAAAPPVDTFQIASMLRDVNDAADTVETIEEVVEVEAYEPAEPPAAPEPREPAHANSSRSGLSETAALMRELSSLGLEDEPAQPPAARTAAAAAAVRPASPAKDPKKRKGLFGRG